MDESMQSRSAITAALEALRLPVRPELVDGLARHLEMVYQAAATMNLTAVPLDEAPALHVMDSLLGLDLIEAVAPDGPLADIGSGAGFPGIPLALASGREVHLIESTGKKAAFLSTVARELCLDVTVHGCRAEEAALLLPRGFSAVTARAVGPLSELVELASPLLAVKGAFVAYKAKLTEDELAAGDRVARLTGMAREHLEKRRLPAAEQEVRTFVVYRKCGNASVRLPRRPGLARKSPLG